MDRSSLTVSELNRCVKGLLDSEEALRNLWVRGEISNFRHHRPSGHMYFSLKDDQASVRAVMFRSYAARIGFAPEDGLGVLASGSASLYERDGQYQLYVRELEPSGVGALHLAFEQLRAKLLQEGLFADENKKPLPLLPRRVGIVTSLEGAALQDIIQVSRRRFSGCQLVVEPARVQGAGAAEEISAALLRLDQSGLVDVIIVGRGGGSLEDLWAFNEETLARAIFESRTPVVSAVGHETDVTIADLVADARAATPSVAAELVFASRNELVARVSGYRSRLGLAAARTIAVLRTQLATLAAARVLAQPTAYLDGPRQSVDTLGSRLAAAVESLTTRCRHRLALAAGRLGDLSPLAVLGRGYSICRSETGAIVTSATEVQRGSSVEVMLATGRLECLVQRVAESLEGGWSAGG